MAVTLTMSGPEVTETRFSSGKPCYGYEAKKASPPQSTPELAEDGLP